MHTRATPLLLLPIALLACAASLVEAQELAVAREPIGPPAEVAQSISALLGPEATVVMRGGDRLEFWWVKTLPLQSAPAGTAVTWANVAEGSLIGVLRTARVLNDSRGLPVKPGVYTLRFARQPQDGDHMGVSPFREFLTVGPAAADQSPDALGFKGAVALAKKTLGKSHPAALSLDPPVTDQAAGTVVTNEAGHQGVTFSVPAIHAGLVSGTLGFGVMLIGHYDH